VGGWLLVSGGLDFSPSLTFFFSDGFPKFTGLSSGHRCFSTFTSDQSETFQHGMQGQQSRAHQWQDQVQSLLVSRVDLKTPFR
jgi:hypothetical protein